MYLYVLYQVYVIKRINGIDSIKKSKPNGVCHGVEGCYLTFNPLVRKHDTDISIYDSITSPYSYGFIAPFFWCVTRYAY